MYISNIKLQNIRCFGDVSLELENNGTAVNWITFLGDNSTGKTTLLRSIAIGLCDLTSSAGLLREIPWEFRKQFSHEDGKIIIDLSDENHQSYTITTKIKFMKSKRIEKVERTILDKTKDKCIDDDDFPWGKVFLCGFGASRGTEGTVDYLKYSTIDAVYTLFSYDQPLQNPELAMRRLIQKFNKSKKSRSKINALNWLTNQLKPILLLDNPSDDITIEEDGIWVRSNRWGKVPLKSIGDGYKGTLTWVMDFISWASLFGDDILSSDIRGIVLLDEVEQHLHPRWQRNIVHLLRKTFSKIQFFTTTHSPLVAANASQLGIDDFESKLFHLVLEGESVQLSEINESLGELDCDQILSSEAFDYILNVNPKLEQLLKEASNLAAKANPTDEESIKLKKFKNALKEIMFPKGRTLIERIVERDYYKEIENRIDEFYQILNGVQDDQD